MPEYSQQYQFLACVYLTSLNILNTIELNDIANELQGTDTVVQKALLLLLSAAAPCMLLLKDAVHAKLLAVTQTATVVVMLLLLYSMGALEMGMLHIGYALLVAFACIFSRSWLVAAVMVGTWFVIYLRRNDVVMLTRGIAVPQEGDASVCGSNTMFMFLSAVVACGAIMALWATRKLPPERIHRVLHELPLYDSIEQVARLLGSLIEKLAAAMHSNTPGSFPLLLPLAYVVLTLAYIFVRT